jgi:hypothetical protein
VKRRAFITLLGGTVAWPLAARRRLRAAENQTLETAQSSPPFGARGSF